MTPPIKTSVPPKRGLTGYFAPISTTGEKCRAFVPNPLPPTPAISLDAETQSLMEQASLAVGRLDGLSAVLPDTSTFLYSYVRKEAVLSSQIEGTQSTLSDLLLFESEATPGVPLEDVQQVSNYVAALNRGLERLRQGIPISLRLIKELHAILLSKGRGRGKEPGEFRRSQNWIGGSRPGNATFVPPRPDLLLECLGLWEKFLHEEPKKMPLLIKAALAHVQFETIHPFLDGNGRIGRLLITLLIYSEGALREPTLYLSLHFKQHRDQYYDLLQRVRTHGEWEAWLQFFFTAVRESTETASNTARRLMKLGCDDERRVAKLGRAAGTALRLHRYLQTRPISTIGAASTRLSLSVPTITSAFNHLQRLGIVQELTGQARSRIYAYKEYLSVLGDDRAPDETR